MGVWIAAGVQNDTHPDWDNTVLWDHPGVEDNENIVIV